MRFEIVIRRLILAFAVLGLILAPVARPAMAMAMPAEPTMSADMSASDAADMPCCPDGMVAHADKAMPLAGDPAKGDCAKDCPMMAACMATSVTGLSESPVLSFPLAITEIVFPKNDPNVGSFTRSPSPRPPNA
ncbi:MAG: hypothetical protein QOJ96_440 [Alphaproteobacteria bacterium]|jgi:hypothetical protein|nr:hypothetical protein [Alphaproteobacteria bacterium]